MCQFSVVTHLVNIKGKYCIHTIDVKIYSLGARKYAPLDGLAAPGLGID